MFANIKDASTSDFCRASSLSEDVLQKQLEQSGLSGLTGPIWAGVEQLRSRGRAASTRASLLTAKFASEPGTFKLEFGGLDRFFGGLGALIGSPRFHEGSLLQAMAREHCAESDSREPFDTTNGVRRTTSVREWEFVAEPRLDAPAGWYAERAGFEQDHPEWRRSPLALDELSTRLTGFNAQLEARHQSTLILEEGVGGRLYTGPLYEKYNAVLRACSSNPFLVRRWRALCKGNRYPTTIHAINSCVIKASKLTAVGTVFRGFSGGLLPDAFWKPNEDGFSGGVEYAFLSTSTDRTQAIEYASGGGASTVLEMRMGMVDRGADLTWLSQYPHEKEVLFPPLTGLEARGARVDGGVLVVEASLSLNMNALTLEEFAGKRRKLFGEMVESVLAELRADLSTRIGCHPFTCCWRSNMKPIVGVLYQHTKHFNVQLCQSEFDKLPKESESTSMMERRSEFVQIAPLTEEEVEARCALAQSALTPLHSGSPAEWFNDDRNYEACVRIPVMIKQQLKRQAPPMIRTLGYKGAVDVLRVVAHEANADDANSTLLESVQALTSENNFHEKIRYTKLTTLKEAAVIGGRAELLRLLAEGETCYLRGRDLFESLPDGVFSHGVEHSLVTVSLADCAALVRLPESIGNLRVLEQLLLRGCKSLVSLPSSVRKLNQMLKLDLSFCQSLAVLPDLVPDFASPPVAAGNDVGPNALEDAPLPRLEALLLSNCELLSSLPPLWAQLAALQRLELDGCVGLTSLPSELNWPRLKNLSLQGCRQLADLPALTLLTQLETLHLGDCKSLVELPQSIGELSRLRFLNLGYCSGLTAIPNLSGLSAINDLYLHSCSSLTKLPGGLNGKSMRLFALPEHLTQSTTDVESGDPVGSRLPTKIGGQPIK